ncbi:conserved hypothetical protein [Verrucomicrobia bacterium]|nr:conserved hypothetical protein [Verrucomicrobiota bacterium]
MGKFFARNIDRRGRIARGLCGLAMIVAGLLLRRVSLWLCLGVLLAGGFVLFEAGRGWCLIRACGIKTKM